MTVVNTETGEVLDTIGADAARRLTTEAQTEFKSASDHHARGWELIEQAVMGGGHLDLGYRSPGDYLHAEFDGALAGLDVTTRRLAVRSMSGWGLSTRAIAPVIGASDITVRRDLSTGATYVAPLETPEPAIGGEPVTGSGQTPEGGEVAPAVASAPTVERSTPSRPPVIGIDGKTYPAAGRATPRPEAERTLNTLVMHTEKAAREAKNLTPEQLRRIKPKADLWTVGLRDSLETLQGLLTSLTEEK